MKNVLLMVMGMILIGLAAPVNAQVSYVETFEDDAVGSQPSAYGPTYYGNNNLVVASGLDGIDSPDGSAKYTQFVGPRLGSSFWFNEDSITPSEVSLPGTLSADFYIDPTEPVITNVYLASTFWVNGVYKGEIGLGYKLLNNGSGNVTFHVTRFQGGNKNLQTVNAPAGWYHLEMVFADSDSNGLVDVTGVITNVDSGSAVYTWVEPTALVANADYSTAGFQIQAGSTLFVPLRADNLEASSPSAPAETVKLYGKINTDRSYGHILIDIGRLADVRNSTDSKVVKASIDGVSFLGKKLSKLDKYTYLAKYPTAGITKGVFEGALYDGTLIRGTVEVGVSE